jgi:hypothetical protein
MEQLDAMTLEQLAGEDRVFLDRLAAREREKVQKEMAHLRAQNAMLRSELQRRQVAQQTCPEPRVETDWSGNPVPRGEEEETEILVWEVDPHPDAPCEYDVMWCRSWQKMLQLVCGGLESLLEQLTEEELLTDPLTIKIKLRRMSLGDYWAACDDA